MKHFHFQCVWIAYLNALMNKSTIVVSHVAIFALGVSVAFIIEKDPKESNAGSEVAVGGNGGISALNFRSSSL